MSWFEQISNSWWFKAAMYAALAAIGGMLGYIMRALDKKEAIIWWRVLVEALGAAFVGLLFMLICQELKFSQGYTGVVVGVAGWLGSNVSIRMLETSIRKRFGLNSEPSDGNPTNPSGGN